MEYAQLISDYKSYLNTPSLPIPQRIVIPPTPKPSFSSWRLSTPALHDECNLMLGDPYPVVIFLEHKGHPNLTLLHKIMLAVTSQITPSTLLEIESLPPSFPKPHIVIGRKTLFQKEEIHTIMPHDYGYIICLEETYSTQEEKRNLWNFLKRLSSHAMLKSS